MDWTNRNVNPNKVVALGDEVEVMILEIDEERRRISLGVKQCKPNPWDDFADNFNKSDKVIGKIKSITDFGIFIGLDGGIDGLIHLSDLSWNDVGEEAVRNFKKGDEIEAIVLSVDPDRERISLGVKQLDRDPFGQFVADNPKGTIVKGIAKEVDSKSAVIELAEGVEGILRANEISRDRVEDVQNHIKVGEEIEAKFVGIDRKSRMISLSIKAKDNDDEAEALSDYAQSSVAPATTLGDLLKEQMKGSE
jgi:small subunit ribosomal protein S1